MAAGLSLRWDGDSTFLFLLFCTLTFRSGSTAVNEAAASFSQRAISSAVNWPAVTGLRPTILNATSPSAIACTSNSCSSQKSPICLNVKVVFSTSQTAVALGINGAVIVLSFLFVFSAQIL